MYIETTQKNQPKIGSLTRQERAARMFHFAEKPTERERDFLELFQMYGVDVLEICPVQIPPTLLHLFHTLIPTHQTHTYTPTDTPTQKTKNGRANPDTTAPTYNPKPWKKLTRAERMQFAANVAQNFSGLAFTLNLNEREEQMLLANPDPVRALTDRINRQLKAVGMSGTPYALALEISPKGRLHAHGMCIPLQGADLKDVIAAFRKAGGLITKQGAAARQACFRSMFNADGWERYLRKAQKKTKTLLDVEKVTFISQSLGQQCKQIQAELKGSAIN